MFNKSFNNIKDSTIIVNLPHPQNPSQLSHKSGTREIVGRVKELEEIEQDLSNNDALLLINGIGGIGKSTIAGYYLHSKNKDYDYFGFFEGLEGFESELIKLFGITDLQNGFELVLQKLRALKGKKLIVIDNLKDIKNNRDKIEKVLGLSVSGYKIILTSRVAIDANGLKDYNLDRLSKNDSIELFKKYCSNLDKEDITTITEAFDGHPLFIEHVAKAIANGISKEEIISKIKSQELSKIEYIDEEGEILNFEKNLEVLFELQKDELKDDYLKILQKLSCLPAIEIDKKLLKDIFVSENQIVAKLNFLVKRGWLIEIDNSFKMHQIVKEYFLIKYPINSTEKYFEVSELNFIHLQGVLLNLKKKHINEELISGMLIKIEATAIEALLNDEYLFAELVSKNILKIKKYFYSSNSLDTLITCFNVAILNELNGNYSIAANYYSDSLKMLQEVSSMPNLMYKKDENINSYLGFNDIDKLILKKNIVSYNLMITLFYQNKFNLSFKMGQTTYKSFKNILKRSHPILKILSKTTKYIESKINEKS